MKKIIYSKSLPVNSIEQTDRELNLISNAINEVSEHFPTEITNVAPLKNVNFTVRYADGVNWNPRGLGEGLYISINGVWKKINLT